VRLAVREGREGNLVLFCVDASGSMGTSLPFDSEQKSTIQRLYARA